MTPEQALALLRSEVQAQSAPGKALLVLLEHAELAAYRQTARTNDALATANLTGRAQGINSLFQTLTPTPSGAQQDRPGRV